MAWSTERVIFVEPVSAKDLRVVMTAHTAPSHDVFAVAYRTPYGEARVVSWLTEAEANRRANELRKRGYRVAVGLMDHVR